MKEIKDVVTWLKNWFYDKTEVYTKNETYGKSEVDTALNGKLNKNLTTANKNLVTDGSGDVILEDKPIIPDISGKIDTAGTGLSKSGTTLNHSNSITALTPATLKKIAYDAQGHITGTADPTTNDITDGTAHSNIGSSANATQSTINGLIDTEIGNLKSIKAIEVVQTLPTAGADTMGKLYIINEGTQVNVYYTQNNGGTYTWHEMDTDILDDLSIDWGDIENNPFDQSTPASFATAGHQHGNLTNDGKLTTSISSTNKIVVTDSYNNIGTVEVDEFNCGTFAELQELIGTEPLLGRTITLTKDYKNAGNEPAITVPAYTTIFGNGHIIDADEKSRIFILGKGVSIIGMTFKNGKATQKSGEPLTNGYGGAIYAPNGYDDIIKCNFINNNATWGGAIYCNYDHMLIRECGCANLMPQSGTKGVFVHSAGGTLTVYNCINHGVSGTIYSNVINKPYVVEGEAVTSIELIPKGSDPTADAYNGVIRLYYGDEPTN